MGRSPIYRALWLAVLSPLLLVGTAAAKKEVKPPEERYELIEELPSECFKFYAEDETCQIRHGKVQCKNFKAEVDRSKPECKQKVTVAPRQTPTKVTPCVQP